MDHGTADVGFGRVSDMGQRTGRAGMEGLFLLFFLLSPGRQKGRPSTTGGLLSSFDGVSQGLVDYRILGAVC